MSAAPTPTPPQPNPPPNPSPAPVSVAGVASGKLLLGVAAALFIGWIGWLSFTALTKSKAPTVSHAQAAAAGVPVHARLTTGTADKERFHRRASPLGGEMANVLKEQADKPAFIVTVAEQLTPGGPAEGTEIAVTNLPACGGYSGPGDYLLLLNREDDATIDGKPAYVLIGQQRSPGADLDGFGPPRIYPWGDDVAKQVKRLYP